MRTKKIKVIITITSTFLVCCILSIIIDGVINQDALFLTSKKPDTIETVVGEVSAEDTKLTDEETGAFVTDNKSVITNDESVEKADTVNNNITTVPIDTEATAEEEEASGDDTDSLNTEATAEEEEASGDDTDSLNTEVTAEEEASDDDTASLNKEVEENSGIITKAETSIQEEEQLIGVFSSNDWYISLEIPPTSDYVTPNVTTEMNVREGPSTDTKIIGKLKVKNYAKLLERGEKWSQIQSGNVIGYVSNEYLYMDKEALDLFDEWDAFQIKINAGSMNVREKPNTECEIVGQARGGEIYTWYPDKSDESWFAIQYKEDTLAYVSDVYTESIINLKTAETIAEETARIREETYAKVLERSKKNPPPRVNRDPIELTDDELYLMAVVVAMEALWESYEGKLAVANVIINRMLDGHWGDTLHDVIYAPGQFTGANSGRVEEFWNQANDDCKRATAEAVSGINNIDDYMYFITLRKAVYDKYDKCYVLGGHCFYERQW